MISAIVAVDNNWGIGFQGKLLERIPADLKYFKEITNNSPIIMGRKTWESLPKKPLPNRTNIVISSIALGPKDGARFWSMEAVKDILLYRRFHRDFFIIGGGTIYKQLLPICDKVYVTKIYKNHDQVDTYFPNLDKSNKWKLIQESELQTYNDLSYQFCIYEKIN